MPNLMTPWLMATPAEQVERWENVLRVLNGLDEHIRQRHWDMSMWGYKNDCGTVACAAGHCGLDPWFQERGFRLTFVMCRCCNPPVADARITDVTGFFGREGSEIFYNPHERSVEEVIEEVKQYLDELKS